MNDTKDGPRVGDRVRMADSTPWRGQMGIVAQELGDRPCARGGVWRVQLDGPLEVVVFGDELVREAAPS